MARTPSCSLRSSMTRTSAARIWSLILSSLKDVDRPGFELAVTQHRHVGNLLQLCVPDLGLHPLAARIDLDPKVTSPEAIRQSLHRLQVAIRDRNEYHLHWRQPDREGAPVELDQVCHESLEGTDGGTVNHHRPFHFLVGRHVLEAKAFGHQEVDLVGRE